MPCAENSIGRRRVSPLMSAISRHSIRLSPMSGLLRNQYASCQIDLRRMTRASVCRTVMSGSGQNRKSSDVCFAPVSGHRQAVSACPKSANKRLMHPCNGISNRPSHKRARAICGRFNWSALLWRINGLGPPRMRSNNDAACHLLVMNEKRDVALKGQDLKV